MDSIEPPTDVALPERPWFHFSLRTMLLVFVVLASSLAVFGMAGLIVFALVGGLALCAAYLVVRNAFEALVSNVLLVMMLLPVVRIPPSAIFAARESARRLTCEENLKKIILALQVYHQMHGSYPPAYVADKSGKPMYSWRVLILPQLNQAALYKSFNLNEPWDGPNNKKLVKECPKVFICPSDPPAAGERPTNYVAVVGRNAAWSGAKPRTPGTPSFTGDPSNTISLVEVADSNIAWSEPRDLSLESLGSAEGDPAALTVSSKHGLEDNFFYSRNGNVGAEVAFADNHVIWLPRQSPQVLRKMLSLGGYDEMNDTGIQSAEGELQLNWSNIAAFVVWLGSVIMLLTLAVRRRMSRKGRQNSTV